MKCLLSIAAFVLCLTACKKTDPGIAENNTAIQTENGIGPAQPYEWSTMEVPNMTSYPNNSSTGFNLIIPVNGDVYCVVTNDGLVTYKFNNSTKRWELYTDFIVYSFTSQYLFSYQGKIYEGLNRQQSSISNNFSSRDPSTHTVQVLAAFPGTTVEGAFSFVLGNKGYITGGHTQSGYLVNHLWEYDFATNQWTSKGNGPLGARANGIVMVANNKVYMGLGYTHLYFNGQQIMQRKNDWIRFDPVSGYSAVLPDYPGAPRTAVDGFVLNNMPYVGFGNDGQHSFNDLHKYNTSTNTWIQQENWPVSTGSNGVSCFSVGNTGYLVKGALAQFWRFSNSIFQ